jgi:hypothetical protein
VIAASRIEDGQFEAFLSAPEVSQSTKPDLIPDDANRCFEG